MKCVAITLTLEHLHSTTEFIMPSKDTNSIENSKKADQTAQSDLGLHCLSRPVHVYLSKT